MSQLKEYLYAASGETGGERALIILPEIYGVQDFTRELADKVEAELGWRSYVLDHFYAVTGKVQTFDYADATPGIAIMNQMQGEKYLKLLEQAVQAVRAQQPELKRLAVWGFCFGGKLAYLSGVNQAVTDIVSFYGGASLAPDFYRGKSAVEALCAQRAQDPMMRIFAAFGEHDEMIPQTDVDDIRQKLQMSGIQADVRRYDAGHAFFNEDRTDRFVKPAAETAWRDVSAWLQT